MAAGHAWHQSARQEWRIILFGKTGVGKSSSGNTILRERVFAFRLSSSPVSSQCAKGTAEFEGQMLSVVDTPGLFDTKRSHGEVARDIATSISLAAPGPHVFLIVLTLGRFTELERNTVKTIQEMIGDDKARYSMVLFTHGDYLEANESSIEEYISRNSNLRAFIRQCGGGYHVFNNRDEDPSQVRELLEKINTMVQSNEGGYYTNEMLQEVRAATHLGKKTNADLDMRIVLVGETDAGKSSSGNTICGKRVFTTKSKDKPISFCCKQEITYYDGKCLSIVDTPGWFDSNKSSEEVEREITKSVVLAAPGPHVLLVVLRQDQLSYKKYEGFKIIKRMFGDRALTFSLVLFTHGDELKHGKTIDEVIDQCPDLRTFIRQCGGRYHVFNNRDEDPSQVRELLEKINTMVQSNRGGCYINEMFKAAEKAIQEQSEFPRRENPDIAPMEARRQEQRGNYFIKAVIDTVTWLFNRNNNN